MNRFNQFAAFVAAGWACISSIVAAETHSLSVEQTTSPGTSVFALASWRELGGGDVTKSVRLSPHNYPTWSASFDIPPGLTVTPSFYLRNDAADQLGTASNGTLASVGTTFTADATGIRGPIHYVVTPDNTLQVTLTVSGAPSAVLPMAQTPYTGGQKLWTVQLDPVVAAEGRDLRLSIDGTLLPTDGTVRAHFADTWWRHAQAFRYEPPTAAPAAARVTTFSFTPSPFAQRTIRVLLPRGYDANTSISYPVLYAQDGQNVFAPGGLYGSWDLDVTVASLIRRGEIPEIILVGIDNSSSRIAEYTPEYGSVGDVQGRGGEFLTSLRDSLLPEIGSRYRVLQGPANTAHIGSSLGGLLGFLAANDFKTTWGTVAALSSSFQINTDENLRRAGLGQAAWGRLYIDAGTNSDGYTNTAGVRDAFIRAGHILGPNFQHAVALGAGHNEASWRARSPEVLRWIYRAEPTNTEPASSIVVR